MGRTCCLIWGVFAGSAERLGPELRPASSLQRAESDEPVNEEQHYELTDRLATPPPHAEAPAAPAPRRHESTHFIETTQTVVTALLLAFIFRAFFVEQFVIPTGSMAPTLLGVHATLTCPACGWEFNYAPLNPATADAEGFDAPRDVFCPNCHLHIPLDDGLVIPKAGDRILVHKWLYPLGGPIGPQRWDVVVFRDPANPAQHYIKRLIGLPGESIEIVAGDLYIDGQIVRKPAFIQEPLWFVVFDQDHAPAGDVRDVPGSPWVALNPPLDEATGWSGLDQRVFRHVATGDELNSIVFDAGVDERYLTNAHPYNPRSTPTLVHDVRLRGDALFGNGTGWCEWEILHHPDRFVLRCHANGTVELLHQHAAEPAVLFTADCRRAIHAVRPFGIEFGHVDYCVYAKINGREVFSTTDAEYSPRLPLLRVHTSTRPVGLRIGARAVDLTLRELRVDRDIHYAQSPHTRRAYPGHPFTLKSAEYFVLGDNSVDSYDSREWTRVGPHLPADYRVGTVRADQIVGQAAFVYLPGLLPLDVHGRWRIPDIGRVRFVR